MENQITWLTQFVNHYLGSAAMVLLNALHITPTKPETPIPEHVVMGVLVLIVGTVFALYVKSRLSVDKPGAMQQMAEGLLTNSLGFGAKDLLEENTHHASKFLSLVATIGIFVLIGNMMGAVPFLRAPTGEVSVPLGCAVIVFLYFNWQGVRKHGPVGYVLSMTGGVQWWLWPLIIPVEILSVCARLLSLTVRLWANMFASDLIYSIFLGLLAGGAVWGWTKSPILGVVLGIFPALVPVAFLGLHLFVSIIQAYVFTVLPSVYLGLATSEEH